MEAPDELDPQPVMATPVIEAGYCDLPAAEPQSFSVLLSPDGQLTSFVLPHGGGGSGDAVLTALPRRSSDTLKPAVVNTLSALVDAAVPPSVELTDADDPLESADNPLQSGSEDPLQSDAEHCLVCNSRQSDGERLPLFDASVCTTSSRRPALDTLEAAVEAALDPLAAHSQVICSACFDLTDRLDQLQEELRQARDAVRRLYWHTAGMYLPQLQLKGQQQQQQQGQESQPEPQQQQQEEGQEPEPQPQQQQEKQSRRRPQRAATQHGPGHYRSMAEGQSEPEPPPPPPAQPSPPPPALQPSPASSDGPPEPPAHCYELDVDIHVEKASPKKRTATAESIGIQDDRLTCRYCSKTFQRPARLRQHEAAHTQDGSANQCHQCSKTFSQKYYLREHIKQVHERRSLHSCGQCDKVFLRRLHLDDHVRTHSGDRPYTCDVCGRGFSQRGNLRTHAMVHTDQFPFQCDMCGKRLRTRQALEAHQRKHNDDRRFSCNLCSSSYLLKRSLERHQRKHTGDRPFKCSQCDRAFRDRGDLRCHEGIHSASRAHVCPLCGQGFTRRYKMQMHLRAKHDRTDSQVQELCLLQQTAHTMLQQSQQKMEPIAVLDIDEGDHQQHTATDPRSTQLLVLASSPSQLPTD